MQAETIPFTPPAGGVKNADLTVLVGKRRDLIDSINLLKSWLTQVDDEIVRRIDVVSIFDRHDKSYGEISEPIDGGRFKAKVKIAKTVKWDSDGLLRVAKKLPWETANQLFDIDFSMGEKKYATLELNAASNPEASAILEGVNAARTVRFADPKLVSVEENI